MKRQIEAHSDLSNNSFYGQLQLDFSHLSLLQNINLARNSINGRIPVGLSHCYNLEEIYFEHNQLIGNLPSELGDLPRLRILDVAANNLTGGKIPYSIYNISSLIYLSVAENMLVGELPTDMGLALPNLAEVYLAHNQLEGPIPSSFSNASQIQVLDFSSNHFQGPVPLLGNMNNLRLLHLGLNNLSSTTKLNLQVFNSLANSTHIGECKNLKRLGLRQNRVNGSIPKEIFRLLDIIEIYLAHNELSGSLPALVESLEHLESMDLSSNSLTGQIPEELQDLLYLQILNLSFNDLGGPVPRKECSLGSRISTSRDVYSFGILLLEIFTAKKPTDDMFQEGLNQNKLASALLINQFLDMADKRLFNDDACIDYSIFTSSSGCINSIECITAIIHVGLSCAAHSTTDRSTMREALTKLHDIKAFLLDL
ncbi:unnamed protein product, partial [Vitis vinifera]|uniref:LRR receptor-like serine/threonine-protein kinase n=1 Tax=Vitis vinifera TaxID=29760 RepID=E0CQQ7_VITVI